MIANINVGVLGHVDSGKTSLSKALSRIGSTAAFDQNPQSQARGITLDLGFSAFDADVSSDPTLSAAGVAKLQFTLVDCPGHASLIRTVLGGAQIIDVMLLVIDVTKGIQTQTAECIVVGEILSRRLIVILNKIDAVQGNTDGDKTAALNKTIKKLRAVFSKTRWPNAPFIQVCANPGAGEGENSKPPIGMQAITDCLVDAVRNDVLAKRLTAHPNDKQHSKDLLMLVDHCFAIKGQGTVLTGTVLQGCIKVGDDVFLPDHQQVKRVKGIQMFRKPVSEAHKGDRVGVCVAQFNAEAMERGVVCGVGGRTVQAVRTAIARVHKVRFHTLAVEPALKYHVTMGHSTVMGTMRFFAKRRDAGGAGSDSAFDFSATYDCVDALPDASTTTFASPAEGARPEDHLSVQQAEVEYFAVLLLEQAVTSYVGATLIISRLDTDVNAHTCRIAAHGTLLTADVTSSMFPATFPAEAEAWRMLRVEKPKRKVIAIDRILDEQSCISKSIIAESQNKDISRFVGAKVALRKVKPPSAGAAAGELVGEPVAGVIEAPFGSSGKVKLRFSADVFDKPSGRSRGRRGRGRGRSSGPAATDENSEGDESGGDNLPEADPNAKEAPSGQANPRPRIEIVLEYVKYPFATKHRFS
jgi:selenocysteine-specific elongation factor